MKDAESVAEKSANPKGFHWETNGLFPRLREIAEPERTNIKTGEDRLVGNRKLVFSFSAFFPGPPAAEPGKIWASLSKFVFFGKDNYEWRSEGGM